jgi:hypothetical protein
MDITPFIPIIVEATKFFFNEVSTAIGQARTHSKVLPQKEKNIEINEQKTGTLSKQEFTILEQNPKNLELMLISHFAEANALAIKSTAEQLEIHIKNLNHLETVQTQYGLLVPLHIKNEIENESTQIIEKSKKLQNLLSSTFGKQIENV